jgi:hypothetical protein
MSTTVSTYLNSIPNGSGEYPLAQSILNKITLAASTTNTQLANAAKSEIPTLVNQLLNSLIANGRFHASTVLALVASANPAGRTLPDIGVLGTVTVAAGVITIAAGAY